MLAATEADLSLPSLLVCLDSCDHVDETSRLGFRPKNNTLHLGSMWSNADTALGIQPILRLEGIRSRYTGKERDSESGLDNFGARYDSSQYGRFMTPDPGNAGADPTNPQSWNMYSYVLNNPLSYTDPSGLDCVYLNDDASAGTVLRGDCASPKDSGIFVNGTVDTTKGATLTSTGGIAFNYTPEGSKDETIYKDQAPNPGLPGSMDQMPMALNGQQMNPQNTSSMDQQRLAAVAKGADMAGHAIPAPCGGGLSATYGRQTQGGDPHAAMQAELGFDMKGGLFLHNNNEAGGNNRGVGMSNGQAYAYVEDGEGEGLAVGEDGTVAAYVGHNSKNGKHNLSFNAYVHITSVSGCHE
jgi:RHS repeat-associated protein